MQCNWEIFMAQTNILLESGTNELEIMEFYIEEEGYKGHYGINVAKVVEIIRPQKITTMPEMRHPAVLGAFAHRNGRIVPLIDVAKYLNSPSNLHEDSKIIVTEFNNVITAFQVSGVNRIYRLSWTDVEAPGTLLQKMSRSAVTGVIRMDDRVIFLLDLEAIVAEMHPDMAMRMDPDAGVIPAEKQYRILHADDSTSIRRLVADLLSKEGRFIVTQSVDGQDAWNTLKRYVDEAAAQNKPITDFVEGVISDIEMPALDGLTLCRQIKDHPVLRVLPVAMFSSLINDSLLKKCAAVSADAQFAKPDLQSLSNKMRDLIEGHK